MQYVDLHAQYMTLYLTSCWKPTETPGTIKAERFVTWKKFLTIDNHWNLQAIRRKFEYIRIIVTDWCYILPTRHAEDTLILKNTFTDPCDTAQLGSLTPHIRKQQQTSSSDWQIMWTDINQKRLWDAGDRHGRAVHNVTPNNDGLHKISP
jgi:hypothetical protein